MGRYGGRGPVGPEEEIKRIKTPNRKEGEMFGQVISLLGGGRLLVYCEDKKERICRIPGKIKRFIWVREGDIVILQPWEIEAEKKADIHWRYTKIQVEWLKNNKKLNL